MRDIIDSTLIGSLASFLPFWIWDSRADQITGAIALSGVICLTDFVNELYTEALDLGISIETFWNSSLAEVIDLMESALMQMIHRMIFLLMILIREYIRMVLQQIRYLQMKLILHLKRAARITKAPRKQ